MADLYTIPQRVLIRGWRSPDVPREGRFRLRNGGSAALGPIAIAGPRTSRFQVDGPGRIPSLGPGEVAVFTIRFMPSANNREINVQDACVFSVAGEPQCYVRLQASRDDVDTQQLTFTPPDSDILPAAMRQATNVAPPGLSVDQSRPRSGRASRAVAEVMKARSSGGGAPMVMLHPEREDLFYMADAWYDSRGRKWDPRTDSEDSESIHAPALGSSGSSPTDAPVEQQEPALPPARGSGRSGGSPPDWVMEFLEGHAPAHPTRPVVSRSENANDEIVAPIAAQGDDGDDRDEDEDDEDEFLGHLERDLSKNRGSARPRQEPAGQWKVSPRDRSRRPGDEEDMFAEQLAQELACAPAQQPQAATRAPGKSGRSGNAHRPTAAERQEQDDKWMQLSA